MNDLRAPRGYVPPARLRFILPSSPILRTSGSSPFLFYSAGGNSAIDAEATSYLDEARASLSGSDLILADSVSSSVSSTIDGS